MNDTKFYFCLAQSKYTAQKAKEKTELRLGISFGDKLLPFVKGRPFFFFLKPRPGDAVVVG